MRIPLDPRPELSTFPMAPGVYLFRDGGGGVLYVGKAKELRRRLASYLGPGRSLPPKTAVMLRHARELELLTTPTEEEALVLEARLIKRFRPRYNVRLRDDKAYPMIRLGAAGPFPRISLVRRKVGGRARYFGPYPSARAARERVRLLAAALGLRTCPDSQMEGRRRPCLQHQIGRCSAPCCGLITPEEYRRRVEEAAAVLEGRQGEVVARLRREMEAAAEALEFERAAMLRDRIGLLEQGAWRGLELKSGGDMDILGVAVAGDTAVVAVVEVRHGVVEGELEMTLTGCADEEEGSLLYGFASQWYLDRPLPRELVVPVEVEGLAPLLAGMAPSSAPARLTVAPSGIRGRLLKMAAENARQGLQAALRTRESWEMVAQGLARLLGLPGPPQRVEGVDISNTSGIKPVGSLVAFLEGRPWKRGYRTYHLDSVPGPDDFAMIHETVRRRLERTPLPHLILIDGGRGQLSAARAAVDGAGLGDQVALAALAKDRGRGHDLLYDQVGRLLELPPGDPVLSFLQRVRDEAHRFGLKAHRRRRDRASLRSRLLEVEGIGPKRFALLMERFGSPAQVARASEEELAALPTISPALARRIKEALGREGR